MRHLKGMVDQPLIDLNEFNVGHRESDSISELTSDKLGSQPIVREEEILEAYNIHPVIRSLEKGR